MLKLANTFTDLIISTIEHLIFVIFRLFTRIRLRSNCHSLILMFVISFFLPLDEFRLRLSNSKSSVDISKLTGKYKSFIEENQKLNGMRLETIMKEEQALKKTITIEKKGIATAKVVDVPIPMIVESSIEKVKETTETVTATVEENNGVIPVGGDEEEEDELKPKIKQYTSLMGWTTAKNL